MPTIQDLPPEILARVFRFANVVFEVNYPIGAGRRRNANVFTTLINGSLVCTAWTVPCQKELWTSLSFCGKGSHSQFVSSSIRKFISSPLTLSGDFKTLELSVGCDMERILLLLHFCKGIRILELGGAGSGPEDALDMEVLQNPSLAG